jgi:membrane protein
MTWPTWRGVLWRSVNEFLDDNCTDWAAALTYYGVLAMFPSAIVVVALVGLFSEGQAAVDTIMDMAGRLVPGGVVTSLQETITNVVLKKSSAKVLFSFGLVGALWSASGFVGAFTRASNAIYEVREGRPFYKLRPLQLGLTGIALVLMAVVALVLVVSGPVTDAMGDALHLGDTPRQVWSIGKWPVLFVVLGMLLSLLFWIAPNVRQPRFRWLTIGGGVALLAWALVSVGFGLYVANFGSYDVTYGTLGAVAAFLVWLYLSNCAVLLGVEINAELQRGRQIQAGDADAGEPILPPRTPAGT